MKRTCLVGLLVLLAQPAVSADSDVLVLSAAELERLGVEFEPPGLAASTAIAAGPAEVVIPPTQQLVVGPTVSGVLSRILVAEGEAVETGQAVAEIRSPELLALQRDYITALAANELAKAQLERDVDLRAEGIIAERRLEETAAAATKASVALDQDRQQLLLAGLSAGQLDRLADRRQLASTLTLRSPIDGVIVSHLSALGSQVDALGPVFRVADLSPLWLEVRVSEQQAAVISPGMRVIAPEYDDTLSARVFHVGPVVDSVSQTVVIRAVSDDDGVSLRPGQFLPTRIVADAPADARTYVVPSRALVSEGNDSYLFVRTREGVAARQVQLLSNDGSKSYVASARGLDGQLAVAGVAALKSIWLEGGAQAL